MEQRKLGGSGMAVSALGLGCMGMSEFYGASDERRVDNTPDYIRRACETSLRRLGVDAIDLFYLHRLNPETPFEDALGALARLAADGKIGAVGLCEVAPDTLRRAAAIYRLARALRT